VKEQEFECKFYSLVEDESAIRRSLEKSFPSLHFEEGDSFWDKIRVWGVRQDGNIALIRVYRYEGPGAFELTVRLRIPDGANGEREYAHIRQQVLQALGGTMWKPRVAARAVGRKGRAEPKAVPDIPKAMHGKGGLVAECAMEAWIRIGSTASAIPKLILLLKTARNPRRRRRAAESLGKIGDKAQAAIPALIDALHDEDDGVRLCAARALGCMGPAARDAIPALMEVLAAGTAQSLEIVRESLELIRKGIAGTCDGPIEEDP